MPYLNEGATDGISEALRQRLEDSIVEAIKLEAERIERRIWKDGRKARLAAGVVGDTPEQLAQSVIELLCDDPDVWLTHGMPSEGKLHRIEARIVEAIRRWDERRKQEGTAA